MTGRNITIDLLKGFAISAVVIGHISGDLQPSILPVYSFHMPLFFFISGYFYIENDCPNILLSIVKLCKRVVIPSILLTILFITIVKGLLNFFDILKNDMSFFESFLNVYFIGQGFLTSYWFISVYIMSYIYFHVFHNYLYRMCTICSEPKKRFFFLCFYLLLAILSLFCSYLIYHDVGEGNIRWKLFSENTLIIYIIRFIFSLFFFYLGTVSSSFNIQRLFTGKKSIVIFSIIYLMQIYLTKNYETTFSMQIMHFFNPEIAIITSVNGIFFWYIISNFIQNSPVAKIIATIGRYSFSIMSLHIFSFFILNIFFVYVGFISISDISNVYYKYTIYYTYSIYFIVGIFLPIIMNRLIKKVYIHVEKQYIEKLCR